MEYYVGQKAQITKTITGTDVYAFAKMCGDFNSLHMDKITAEHSIFGKRIVHGALVSSFISTVLGMYLPGDGTIYLRQELNFKCPVYFEDTITAKVCIQEIYKNGNAALETYVYNQNGECVIEGTAIVKLP